MLCVGGHELHSTHALAGVLSMTLTLSLLVPSRGFLAAGQALTGPPLAGAKQHLRCDPLASGGTVASGATVQCLGQGGNEVGAEERGRGRQCQGGPGRDDGGGGFRSIGMAITMSCL